ncbi:MAG: von Willebrand factor type A domain-containing protein [Verrucomicrobiales bacterium]|nr:von Willebrand factor type A domain-containing protein [Verrucomicrobiales bacterium]
MNSNFANMGSEELEVQITALLLGELPPETAAALEQVIEKDPQLLQLRARLKKTLEFVEATVAQPSPSTESPAPPLRLSDGRRTQLLEHFKSAPPTAAAPVPSRRPAIRWMVPMAAAAGLMGLAGALFWRSWSPDSPVSPTNLALVGRLEEDLPTAPAEDFLSADSRGGAQDKQRGLSRNEGDLGLFRKPASPPASGPTESSALRGEAIEEKILPESVLAQVGASVPSRPAQDPSSLARPSLANSTPPSPVLNYDNSLAGAVELNGRFAGGRKANEWHFDSFYAGRDLAIDTVSRFGAQENRSYFYSEKSLDARSEVTLGDAAGAAGGSMLSKLQKAMDGDRPSLYGLAENRPLSVGQTPRGVESVKQLADLTAVGETVDAQGRREIRLSLKKKDESSPPVAGVPLSTLSDGEVAAADTKVGEPLAVDSTTRGRLAETRLGTAVTPEIAGKPIESKQERLTILAAKSSESLERGNRVTNQLRVAGAAPVPTPQPEMDSRQSALSTFSLNVTDVSFKLAAASLQNNVLPEAGSIRTEEFINAFQYRDPEPAAGRAVSFNWERARYPFAHDRDVLRLAIKTAAQGRELGRPLNLVLLLDNSGSMERSDRVAILRSMLAQLGQQLKAQDRVSVITFARTPQLRVDGMLATSTNGWILALGDPTPEGGTNLEEALRLAYNTCARHFLSGGVNRVVLITDGAANLGEINAEVLTKEVSAARQRGMALDCFGVGWEEFNDDMLATLSRHGDGRYGFVNSEVEATTEFSARLAGSLRVAASDVKVQVQFNPERVRVWRQMGYARHQLTAQQFRDNTVDAAELGAAEAGQALYLIQVNDSGSGAIGTVRVRYRVPASGQYVEQEWEMPHERNVPTLDRGAASLRLAATAGAFAEWLARSPFAEQVKLDRLLSLNADIPSQWNPDPRPQQLQQMLQQAQALAGSAGR